MRDTGTLNLTPNELDLKGNTSFGIVAQKEEEQMHAALFGLFAKLIQKQDVKYVSYPSAWADLLSRLPQPENKDDSLQDLQDLYSSSTNELLDNKSKRTLLFQSYHKKVLLPTMELVRLKTVLHSDDKYKFILSEMSVRASITNIMQKLETTPSADLQTHDSKISSELKKLVNIAKDKWVSSPALGIFVAINISALSSSTSPGRTPHNIKAYVTELVEDKETRDKLEALFLCQNFINNPFSTKFSTHNQSQTILRNLSNSSSSFSTSEIITVYALSNAIAMKNSLPLISEEQAKNGQKSINNSIFEASIEYLTQLKNNTEQIAKILAHEEETLSIESVFSVFFSQITNAINDLEEDKLDKYSAMPEKNAIYNLIKSFLTEEEISPSELYAKIKETLTETNPLLQQICTQLCTNIKQWRKTRDASPIYKEDYSDAIGIIQHLPYYLERHALDESSQKALRGTKTPAIRSERDSPLIISVFASLKKELGRIEQLGALEYILDFLGHISCTLETRKGRTNVGALLNFIGAENNQDGTTFFPVAHREKLSLSSYVLHHGIETLIPSDVLANKTDAYRERPPLIKFMIEFLSQNISIPAWLEDPKKCIQLGPTVSEISALHFFNSYDQELISLFNEETTRLVKTMTDTLQGKASFNNADLYQMTGILLTYPPESISAAISTMINDDDDCSSSEHALRPILSILHAPTFYSSKQPGCIQHEWESSIDEIRTKVTNSLLSQYNHPNMRENFILTKPLSRIRMEKYFGKDNMAMVSTICSFVTGPLQSNLFKKLCELKKRLLTPPKLEDRQPFIQKLWIALNARNEQGLPNCTASSYAWQSIFLWLNDVDKQSQPLIGAKEPASHKALLTDTLLRITVRDNELDDAEVEANLPSENITSYSQYSQKISPNLKLCEYAYRKLFNQPITPKKEDILRLFNDLPSLPGLEKTEKLPTKPKPLNRFLK